MSAPQGILVVDKPQGFTSFDVVAKLRGICGTRKIGHGGTLDPMATGVLPVFVGRAAKAADLAPNQDKCYEAVIRFGLATDTGDITGTVRERSNKVVDEARLRAAMQQFLGRQQQLPPMYSAVKVGGKPLYKYAREGKQAKRSPRHITIYGLNLLAAMGENDFRFDVHCSKGTYVRTLCEDIGAALGVPATLAALRRTSSHGFGLKDAHTLDAIQAARDEGRLAALLLPVDVLFEELPRANVDAAGAHRLANGAPVYGVEMSAGRCGIYGPDGFIGLGVADGNGALRMEKMLAAHAD